MSEESKYKRRHLAHPRQRQRQPQSAQPACDWRLPFPPLRPEDRLSTMMDYREIVPEYDRFVAEVGEAELKEELDYFYFFLGNSARLAGEPEFQDMELGVDPYDFLIYAAHDFFVDMVGKGESVWAPDGGFVKPYEHIVQHAMARHLTPSLRADLQRRARRTARRCWGTGIGSMAEAVEIGLDDESTPVMIITLLQQLFSRALTRGVLDLAEQFEQDWEERDLSLDRWMEQIAVADFDRPAEQAIEKLAAAGPRALPHLARLFYDMDFEYDDYPLTAVLEIAARVPSQLSLCFLVQALFDDGDYTSELANELLAGLPDLACPYLAYALTVPGGPDWEIALWGYSLLGKARCPGAFGLLVDGLSYQGHGPYDAEVGQISAGEGLLELGDERSIPILRDYLHNPQADLRARSELLYALLEHDGGHPWGAQVAGDLTMDTLPSAEAEDAA